LRALAETDLTQTTYDLLRARIAAGELVPGQRLQLEVLSAQLGVSRTPIRDALNQLAAEGLIEIRPRRGTFVARVDQHTVAELYQLRLMIDGFVGNLVAPTVSTAQLRTLRRLLRAIAAQVHGDTYRDYGAYLDADRAFHSAIISLADNQRLSSLYDEINLPLWLVRAQLESSMAQDNDAEASLAGHREILEALESRDPQRTARALSDHVSFARRRLDAWLGGQPASDGVTDRA
jgi:DNA-binding GntR family transcriptional regulator